MCLRHTHTMQMPAADSGEEGVVDEHTSPRPPPEDSGGEEEDEVWAAMEMVGEGRRKSG